MAETVTNMVGGLYRRIYAGFLTGKRINAVSLGAEAWFWRLHAIADDFGNLPGDPIVLRAFAAPRRELTITEVESMTAELEQRIAEKVAPLLVRYGQDGESYLHIDGFEDRQPAVRHGKRLQRYPMHPRGIQGNPGASRGIQGNPGAVRAPDTDTDTDIRSDADTDIHSKDHSDTDIEKATGAGKLGYISKPGTASDRTDRPFVQTFILKVAKAFGWTTPTAVSQKRSLSAVARRLLKEPDRDELVETLVEWARDKADDPALEKPVAAWQADVTRLLAERDARRNW